MERTARVVAAIAVAASFLAAWATTSRSERPASGRPMIVTRTAAAVSPGDMPDVDTAVLASQDAYIAEQQRQIDAYYAAVEAERARLAEEASRAARQTPPVSQRAAGGSTVGECTGFAIPDYIIQRESGGNPNAMNPSGAYGCAQTLLSHYSNGSCRGLDPYTIDGQRQCVDILSNGGTNLAPWAQTR